MVLIEPGIKLDYRNVLIKPTQSDIFSRSNVILDVKCKFKHSTLKWRGVPILSSNMDTTGTFEVYDVLNKYNIITVMHKFYTADDYMKHNPVVQRPRSMKWTPTLNPDLFMVSTGISDNDYNNLCAIMQKVECNWICIDIANGYITKLIDYCKKVRARFPNKRIVAGNVVTKELVDILLNEGQVDVVKIGIGPGSACSTRVKTGVGYPQLSAVIECAEAARKHGGHIIADGGITCPGDLSKAFGAGAHFVMIGGQFAGHDENPGDVIEENGKKFKKFYGMSSEQAMNKHYGTMNKYRASEGRELKVPYKGPLSKTVDDFLGGLRSTCTYTNSPTLTILRDNVTFIRVNSQYNSSLL